MFQSIGQFIENMNWKEWTTLGVGISLFITWVLWGKISTLFSNFNISSIETILHPSGSGTTSQSAAIPLLQFAPDDNEIQILLIVKMLELRAKQSNNPPLISMVDSLKHFILKCDNPAIKA